MIDRRAHLMRRGSLARRDESPGATRAMVQAALRWRALVPSKTAKMGTQIDIGTEILYFHCKIHILAY